MITVPLPVTAPPSRCPLTARVRPELAIDALGTIHTVWIDGEPDRTG